MLLYRLTRSRYAEDLTGEGARLFGGRWNLPGTACLYTSEHRSLCLCEFLVNVTSDLIPDDLQFVTLRINDNSIYELKEEDLPLQWMAIPTHKTSQEFGSQLLSNNDYIAFRLPSVIIPREYNVILNPNEELFEKKVVIEDISDFKIDSRYVEKLQD